MKTKAKNRNVKLFLIIFFIVAFNFIYLSSVAQKDLLNHRNKSDYDKNSEFLKINALIGHLNLTNYQVNNSVLYHGDSIPLEGKLYRPISGNPLPNYNVSVVVNEITYAEFSDTTNASGEFQIDFQIPSSLNIYSFHKIQVNVTDDLGDDYIELINHYNLSVKAKSSIQNINYIDDLYLTGENFQISGSLVYDNATGIPNETISYHWYNTSNQWTDSQLNVSSEGTFDSILQIPINATPSKLNLMFSYAGMPSYIDPSSAVVQGINIFKDIGCDWNITNLNSVSNYTEGDNITISGVVFTSHNHSLKLINRSIRIIYDGTVISTLRTDKNGEFKTNYTIPSGSGNKAIRVQLVSTSDIQVSATNTINITAQPAPPPPPPPPEPIPFLDFFIYLIPILAGIVGALVVYGFFYYRRQRERSKFAEVPLGNKIVNLNILKETNRLEESLSYLFNAIFSELVKAKYGRMRKENETIRDFAIIMVKEFQLQPTSIYPFIQKIEEVIYAEPFKVTEEHFYKACDLFAPIYFDLTGGQDFVLNIAEFKN